MNYLLVFLIVCGQCMIGNVSGLTNDIHIWNDLDPKHKHTTLFVHCKSGSQDQGPKYIPWGKVHHFGVEQNWRRSKLYWCTLRHGPNYRLGNKFDVYKYQDGVPNGHTYDWIAREDGVYFRRENGPIRKVHNWRPM
ncbi:hypothetical protein CARUB_v10011683mg [Capsella rubella]|uniref:S-protein homolog n=1 Tax=Capsella rubella TaxID=81985 RepID=R0I5I2_9BRAS|nr:S-protein homolog 21 [Capsella rubella]EOA37509.1 hypothetical protein CARUB_v10011683mg [Capsella rubella]